MILRAGLTGIIRSIRIFLDSKLSYSLKKCEEGRIFLPPGAFRPYWFQRNRWLKTGWSGSKEVSCLSRLLRESREPVVSFPRGAKIKPGRFFGPSVRFTPDLYIFDEMWLHGEDAAINYFPFPDSTAGSDSGELCSGSGPWFGSGKLCFFGKIDGTERILVFSRIWRYLFMVQSQAVCQNCSNLFFYIAIEFDFNNHDILDEGRRISRKFPWSGYDTLNSSMISTKLISQMIAFISKSFFFHIVLQFHGVLWIFTNIWKILLNLLKQMCVVSSTLNNNIWRNRLEGNPSKNSMSKTFVTTQFGFTGTEKSRN